MFQNMLMVYILEETNVPERCHTAHSWFHFRLGTFRPFILHMIVAPLDKMAGLVKYR